MVTGFVLMSLSYVYTVYLLFWLGCAGKRRKPVHVFGVFYEVKRVFWYLMVYLVMVHQTDSFPANINRT